jgi:hypothetical protein
MPNLSKSGLQRWYRDSNSLLKKVVAKLRYISSRVVIRSIRLAWFLLTSPIQALAWVALFIGQKKLAQDQFAKVVNLNPWVLGALPGLIKAAKKTGDLEVALSAALKRDRLMQQNHGQVQPLLDEYLVGEPNWFPISAPQTGNQAIELNANFVNDQLLTAPRTPNYAESSLDVIVPVIASSAKGVTCNIKNKLELEPILIGIALSNSPLPVTITNLNAQAVTVAEKRRATKFDELVKQGLIVVKS